MKNNKIGIKAIRTHENPKLIHHVKNIETLPGIFCCGTIKTIFIIYRNPGNVRLEVQRGEIKLNHEKHARQRAFFMRFFEKCFFIA